MMLQKHNIPIIINKNVYTATSSVKEVHWFLDRLLHVTNVSIFQLQTWQTS